MRRFVRLMQLELMRATRDANTLLYIGFPVLAYPLMIWAMLQGFTYIDGANERQVSHIVVIDEADAEVLESPKLVRVEGSLDDLDSGTVDAVVTRDGTTVTVHHRGGSASSRNAANKVKSELFSHLDTQRETAGEAAGVERLEVETVAIGDMADLIGWFLGLFAAILAPATLVISATYPTMELFVIEREKATLETLLTASVNRWEVVLARLFVASGLATVAATANVAALGMVMAHGTALIVSDLSGVSLSPHVGWLAVPVLLASGSVVVTLITAMVYSVARTFREAQTLFSVAAMFLLAPSLVSLMACLNDWADSLVLVPMFHTSTLSFDAIRNQLSLLHLVMALSTDVAFVAVLLGAWHRVFGISTLLSGLDRPRWVKRLLGETA